MDNEYNSNQETIINEIKMDKKSATFNFSNLQEDDESEIDYIENNNKNKDISNISRNKIRMRGMIDHNNYDSETNNNYNDNKIMKLQALKIKSINKKCELKLSIRHTIFIVMMWVACISSLIIGMILHFPLDSGVTASSILWTISFIFLLLSLLFSYFYYKIRYDLISKQDEVRYLSYFPF